MAEYLAELLQLFFVALLVEHMVAVLFQLKSNAAVGEAGTDPWTIGHLLTSIALSAFVCVNFEFDVFSKVTATKVSMMGPWVGWLLTAIVVSGGSAAIRKMIEAMAAATQKSKEESKVQTAIAKRSMQSLGAS